MSSSSSGGRPPRPPLQPFGQPQRGRHGLIVDEVEAAGVLSDIRQSPRHVMGQGEFTRMLAAERMTAWSTGPDNPENRRTARNWQRAPTLHEHYRLGADAPGARLLHRRGQVEQEHYRETLTRMHSVTRTTDRDPRLMTIPEFGETSARAEDELHQRGHIYDPVGVERRAGTRPDSGHDMQSNFAWALGAMHAGHDFEMVGPLSDRSLARGSRPTGDGAEASALLREVRALTSGGYRPEEPREVQGVPISRLVAPTRARSATMRDLHRWAPPTMPDQVERGALQRTGLLAPNIDAHPTSQRMGALRTITHTFQRDAGLQQTWSGGTRVQRSMTVGAFLTPPPPQPGTSESGSERRPRLPPPPPPKI